MKYFFFFFVFQVRRRRVFLLFISFLNAPVRYSPSNLGRNLSNFFTDERALCVYVFEGSFLINLGSFGRLLKQFNEKKFLEFVALKFSYDHKTDPKVNPGKITPL